MSPADFIDPLQAGRQVERIRRLAFAGLLTLSVLLVRLFMIQVLEGDQFHRRASLQSSRVRQVLPERGEILDRNGDLLVGNQPGLRLRYFPDRGGDPDSTIEFIQANVPLAPADLPDLVRSVARTRPYRPETIIKRMSRDTLARISAHSFEHPELEIQTAPLRRYPHGPLAPHLFGYLGEVNDGELGERKHVGLFAPGDVIGKQGVELTYDLLLFGTKGVEKFRVDASGRVQELIEATPARPGWDLRLTLDLETQRAAEAAMEGLRGAVAAIDPENGDVLALVSHPDFDPELFIGGINHEDWRVLREDPGHPLIYRPLTGMYPPGSTYKPLTAWAAMEEGVITPDEEIYCPGQYRLGRRTFRCWRAGGHGKVDMRRALKESCDTYFYEVGRRLGIERLAQYGRLAGFGRKTGIDLENEKGGLVPDPAWKQRLGREPWQEGETIIAAIGQGSVLVTPLQLARFYAFIANGGHLVAPRVRAGFEHTDRPAVTEPVALPVSTVVPASDVWLDVIRDALEAVVHEPRGTGGWSRIRGIRVAGKTGTAQVVRQDKREEELAENLRDHAWFAAYAPADKARIAVAVVVENGGHGGDAAAPVARKVMEAYLR